MISFLQFSESSFKRFFIYFDSQCPFAEEYSSLSLSSVAAVAALFTFLTLNAAKFSISFWRRQTPTSTLKSNELKKTVKERRKAFAAVYASNEDRQACISVPRYASSVIAKPRTEAWQATCSSLF